MTSQKNFLQFFFKKKILRKLKVQRVFKMTS
nr:MAG TPA: hypothetical protein [Caudoviricetes sp.]